MLMKKIKYRRKVSESLSPVEEWMELAHFLGWFVSEQKEKVKLYISVPSNVLFSYFTVLGAVDNSFTQATSKNNVTSKFLDLEYGSQVLYLTGGKWKRCTVLGLEEFPSITGGVALKIKDNKNSTTYVSERKWLTNIRIYSKETSEVKNARIVKNASNLVEDDVLNLFYPKENLGVLEMKNKPNILVSTIKTEWIENLSVVKFFAENKHISFENFIFYDDKKSTFNNVKLIADKEKTHEDHLEGAVVLFIGAGKSLRGMDEYKRAKSIYLVDRYESTEKIEDLKMKISQSFLTEGCTSINELLIHKMKEANIFMPKGVEILAWK